MWFAIVLASLGLIDSFQNHTEKVLVTEFLEMFAGAADVLCHKKQIFSMFLRAMSATNLMLKLSEEIEGKKELDISFAEDDDDISLQGSELLQMFYEALPDDNYRISLEREAKPLNYRLVDCGPDQKTDKYCSKSYKCY